ncbi:uncharacterized protein LOC116666871 [Camelus ferus]|uniref:Uncharacterized protein LOC116666871 n=1 Tax=Camelus ferus TaxID=419612 RepID=A0A8B8TVV8_CAMFR|nr:uncharacterized protein LOC116666871 [Camelus ferus]
MTTSGQAPSQSLLQLSPSLRLPARPLVRQGSGSWQLVLAASGSDARQLFRGGCCGGGGDSAVPPGGAAWAERRPRSVEPSAAATAATGAGPELVRGQVFNVGPRSSSLNREGSYRVVWLIQCDRSHRYQSYEKQRAETMAAQIEVKCHLIDQLYAAKQECASMETTLKYAGLEKEPVNVRSLANAYQQPHQQTVDDGQPEFKEGNQFAH